MPHTTVRLIDQSAGTGCHRDGGASSSTSFHSVVHAFSADAPGAEGKGPRNAVVAAALTAATDRVVACGATAAIACAACSSDRSAAAIAQSGDCRSQTRDSFRVGSVGAGLVRLHT